MESHKSEDTVLLTHEIVKPHMLHNSNSITALNHDIHPERKARSNWVGHNNHIEELSRHVLRHTPNSSKLLDEIFSVKQRHASPWVPRNYETKLGHTWL